MRQQQTDWWGVWAGRTAALGEGAAGAPDARALGAELVAQVVDGEELRAAREAEPQPHSQLPPHPKQQSPTGAGRSRTRTLSFLPCAGAERAKSSASDRTDILAALRPALLTATKSASSAAAAARGSASSRILRWRVDRF